MKSRFQEMKNARARGRLYEKAKREHVIDELRSMNVNQIDGRALEVCEYDRLKEELVLASFRRIDIECDANRWY